MKKIIGLILIVAVAGILVGCETTTPEIKNSQPSGLTIRGTVYGMTQSGLIGDPLEGVVLFLSGDSDSWTTTTDSKGEYRFTDLPVNAAVDGNGNPLGFDLVATKEGYQRAFVYRLNFGTTINPPDGSVLGYDIRMDPRPIVKSIAPALGTTIEVSTSFVVEFNEAMDITSVRPGLTTRGIRGFAVGDTSNITTSWSSDHKTLTITPTEDLLPNMTYRLIVDPGNNAQDTSGNDLDTNATGGGLTEDAYNSILSTYFYRTPCGGAPGNPTNLLLSVNGNAQGNMDYADAVNPAAPMNLSWLAPSSGQVARYTVYVATSSTGPWMLLGEVNYNTFDSTMADINGKLYGATYNPECVDKLAFVTDTVHVKVCAWNAEGESSGVATSERDGVKPSVMTNCYRDPAALDAAYTIPGFGNVAASLTDYSDVLLPATLDRGCYLTFTEPMDISTLEDNMDYDVIGITVTSAKVVYNSAGRTVIEVQFSGPPGGGSAVEVSTSVPTDLSGNTIDAIYYKANIL